MYRQQISQKAFPSLRTTPISKEIAPSPSYGSLSSVVQRVQLDPNSVSEDERQQLESAIGSSSTREVLAGKQTPWAPQFQGISAQLWGETGQVVAPIQAKLIIGEVGDKYEQEADRIAKDVVQQIHTPQTNIPTTLQRQEIDEEELQRKQLPQIVQRREAIAGGEASTDLDTAINTARGSGQPLDVGLQQLMGQAMGADFSGVRVHTDAQSDQLNQSIQARAFTTGQDVFFRQGEYNPGSRGGQELLAHELTHVVQQNGGVVQRFPTLNSDNGKIVLDYNQVIQWIDGDQTISYNFLDNLSDPQSLIEEFITNSNDEYDLEEGVQPFLNDLQAYLAEQEQEEQYEMDDLESFAQDYRTKLERFPKKSMKQKARRNQNKKSERSKVEELQEEFAGMSGKESIEGLNPIESLHEDIFSNIMQGGVNVTKPNRRGQTYLKNMKQYLESPDTQDRNYKLQLEKTRAAILQGKSLVRKMSKAESDAYRTSGGDKEKVFPIGTEGMKAFRIDAIYAFQDSARNDKKEDYNVVMLVKLSPKLQTYFINFLSPNVSNPLEVQEKNLKFGTNPQFKFESGGVTILIPPSGWANFWSFVNNDISFKIAK